MASPILNGQYPVIIPISSRFDSLVDFFTVDARPCLWLKSFIFRICAEPFLHLPSSTLRKQLMENDRVAKRKVTELEKGQRKEVGSLKTPINKTNMCRYLVNGYLSLYLLNIISHLDRREDKYSLPTRFTISSHRCYFGALFEPFRHDRPAADLGNPVHASLRHYSYSLGGVSSLAAIN